ncbi:hypothetical protein HN51_005455 [Arachis hypogaea]
MLKALMQNLAYKVVKLLAVENLADWRQLNCITLTKENVKGIIMVKVKRRGDDTKYMAKVLARGVDCDIALLSVESDEFWRDVEPLRLGRLLHLQDSVTVVGYPLGGDTISVTKGVVSRIEC